MVCVTPSCIVSLLPAIVSTSRRIHGELLGLQTSLPTQRLPVSSRPWARKSMPTLRFTAGVGVCSSGACGLPLGQRARKPLPCALSCVPEQKTLWGRRAWCAALAAR